MKGLTYYTIFSSLFFLLFLHIIPLGVDFLVIYLCLTNFYVIFCFSMLKPIYIGKGTFFKLEIFFLIFFYIIYYSMYQGYVLGLNELNSVWLSGYEEFTNISLVVSSLGMNAFILGINRPSRYVSNENIQMYHPIVISPYNRLSIFLFLVTLVLIFIYARTGLGSLLAGRYLGSRVGDVTTDGLFFLTNVFTMINASVVLYYYYHFRKISWQILILCILILIWILILLVAGDRNNLLLIGIVFFGAGYTFFKSISRKSILIYFFVALFFYQVIEVARVLEDRSFSEIVNVIQERFGPADDSERGFFSDENSFFTTTVGYRGTFYLIPDKHNYTFGKYQFIGLVGIIPFTKGMILDNDDFATTSDFLTFYLKGMFSPMGIGTNVISDLYIDFGLPGVIFFMFFIGRYVYFIENKIRYNNYSIFWFTLYFISLATIAEMPRYTFSFPFRSCIWALVIMFIFEFSSRKNLRYILSK